MARTQHSRRCNGAPHLHIIHLPDRPGRYRLVQRCACSASKRLGAFIYRNLAAAETAARDKPLDQLFGRQKPVSVSLTALDKPVLSVPAIPLAD